MMRQLVLLLLMVLVVINRPIVSVIELADFQQQLSFNKIIDDHFIVLVH